MNDLRIEDARWAPVDIGKTWEKTWKTFTNAPVPWILGALAYIVVLFVLLIIYMVGLSALATTTSASGSMYDPAAQPVDSGAPGVGFFIFMFVMIVLFALWGVLFSININRCAAIAVNGGELKVSSFFKFERFGSLFGLMFAVALIVGVGYVLCIIPGLFAFAFLFFAPFAFFAMQNPSIGGAMRASVDMLKRNPGPTILAILFVQVISAVGQMVIFGAVVTMPLAAIFSTVAFRSSVTGDVNGFGTPGYGGGFGPGPFGGPGAPGGPGGFGPVGGGFG
ncbi:MAG: hypothetical protein Q4A92_12180, partial [Corynebacterium sp.]|nr:hypothetical protein [Corynebacterium sp.]